MGAGKTSIGRELAKKMDLDFIDIDIFIEKRYNKSINQLFSEYGENRFREIECEVLKELSAFENAVISTGGGTACFFDNMSLMNQNGITIYLSATPEVLSKRLYSCRNRRPLIKDKNEDELINFIKDSITVRETHYNKAHIIFDTDQIIKKDDINYYLPTLIQEIYNK